MKYVLLLLTLLFVGGICAFSMCEDTKALTRSDYAQLCKNTCEAKELIFEYDGVANVCTCTAR